jgi:hypothetical protein
MVFINHKMDLEVAFFFDSQKGGFLNRIFHLSCFSIPCVKIKEMFLSIGKSCPNLQALKMSGIFFTLHDSPLQNLVGIFNPLLMCKELVTLEVLGSERGFDICFAIMDKDISQMAATWQNLEVIHLGFASYSLTILVKHPPLTLKAIRALCTHCPQLHSLNLSLDAEVCLRAL